MKRKNPTHQRFVDMLDTYNMGLQRNIYATNKKSLGWSSKSFNKAVRLFLSLKHQKNKKTIDKGC